MSKTNYLQDLGQIIIGAETYILHQGKVLMHKRSNDKKAFPGFWLGPGGHIDQNEDALTAAIREVFEETGVKIKENQIKLKSIAFHHHLDRKELYLLFIYLAEIPHYQEIKSNPQEGHSEWITLSEILTKDNVFPPSKFYFDHVLKDKPGILYTNIQLKNSQIINIMSQKVDKNM